jgi:NAD(P)-dependent dehydrogenase (short-subunit alcohol dehydrogenase family)
VNNAGIGVVGPLAASKSALATLSTVLRQELAPFSIRVIQIDPAASAAKRPASSTPARPRVMDQASPAGRALYQAAFANLASFSSGAAP